MSKLKDLHDHLAKVAIDTEQAPRPKRDKLPDPASEEIYDWVDKQLLQLAKDHPELPLKNIAAKDLGAQAEEKLLAGLTSEINEYFSLNPTPLGYAEATVAVERIVSNWIKTSTGDVDEYIGTLMGLGYLAGLESSDIPNITISDLEVVRQISADPKRIGNSIITFSRGIVNDFRSIISEVYGPTGTHTVGDAVTMMQSRVNSERWKLERIVRTETAQSSGAGRFMGWSRDSERDYYEYHWIAAIDNRTKEISRVRAEGSPYTFAEAKYLWEHQEQLIDGKWWADQYHQRCLPAGEKVMINSHLSNIEDIKIGDRVITHSGKSKLVLKTFNRAIDEDIIVLTVKKDHCKKYDTHTSATVKVTKEHPILTRDRGWVNAGDLNKGDILLRLEKHQPGDNSELRSELVNGLIVESIKTEHYCGTVYDLEVQDDHSFIGRLGIVLHNCSIARYPRNEEFVGNRFDGREDEFRRTAATEFVYE